MFFKIYMSCKAFRFSSVSKTASLCPRAAHLDLAVCQLTFSLYKWKLTEDTNDFVPERNRGENVSSLTIWFQLKVNPNI